MNKEIENFIKSKNVSFFGYTSKVFPDILKEKKSGVLRFFVKKNTKKLPNFENYEKFLDIAVYLDPTVAESHDVVIRIAKLTKDITLINSKIRFAKDNILNYEPSL